MSIQNKVTYSEHTINLNANFQTALRSINSFLVHRIEIETPDGASAIAEVVSTPAITRVTVDQVRSDVQEILIPTLSKIELKDSLSVYKKLEEVLPKNPTVRALGDLALHNLLDQTSEMVIKSDVTVPIAEIAKFPTLIDTRIASGFEVFKMKLGQQDLSTNVQMVQKVQSLIPPTSALRIDPNQAWTVDYSIQFLEMLDSNGIAIEYLEQPIEKTDIVGLATIRANTSTPIMADESCFSMNDLEEIISRGAADWVNIKILKSGGVTPAKLLAIRAQEAGLKISFGCMIESPLGVRAAMELAQQFAPNLTHDLDAAWWYPQSELIYSEGMVKCSPQD